MKIILRILILAAFTLRVPAQTNKPARLALVSESAEVARAVDILTAEFSGHADIQLLERDEIAKVYREQGLSAVNTDYLKLGQILGADGLLLLKTSGRGDSQILNIRLVATKPGVVLVAETFKWPIQNAEEWSKSLARRLDVYLPKLTVALKDSIPLSVVNLRSAIGSTAGRETEQALKVLTIQRLAHEPQLFILERQRMELLTEEKSLKADDSPFWKGSYLFEGVIDQNGYSKEIVTVNARLTPPAGGSPLLFEINGGRTNLGEVVNRLAAKINELLKIHSVAPAWDSAEEAKQYFSEAQWALKWGDYNEAQQAAESAWALGPHDIQSAILRIQAYTVSPDAGKKVVYYPPTEAPDARNIASIQRALDIYNEFSRTLPPDEPRTNSDWYDVGLKTLEVASRVLQVFNYSPNFYWSLTQQLSGLRATVRATADWISKSPSVHDSYFVGDRVVFGEELDHFRSVPNIFSLKLTYGPLWQEKPEDNLPVYRELMASPVFCYIHYFFWFRDLSYTRGLSETPPRFIAWNKSDAKRIPEIWIGFKEELRTSTNALWRLEAKAIDLAEAINEATTRTAFTNFFTAVFEHPEVLLSNNVELLRANWQINELVSAMHGDAAGVALLRIYDSDHRPKLDAMREEFRNLAAFEKQKQYLEAGDFIFSKFVQTFDHAFKAYSRDQALELRPLLELYKTNLIKNSNRPALISVNGLEKKLDEIINPPSPKPKPVFKYELPKTGLYARPSVSPQIQSNQMSKVVSDLITVKNFLPFPLEEFPEAHQGAAGIHITAHHWFEGKLVLDIQYHAMFHSFDRNGNWRSGLQINPSAIAIFDPVSSHWQIIPCSEAQLENQSHFYHRSVLFKDELFNSDFGQVKKYDFNKKKWDSLPISDDDNYQLFAVNGKLYAASKTTILEILGGGKSTRILASNRRQPPASKLDTQTLGTPFLFEGPDHSLRASIPDNVFTWTSSDWQANEVSLPSALPPALFPSGVLFKKKAYDSTAEISISFLANDADTTQLYIWKKITPRGRMLFAGQKLAAPLDPLWKLPEEMSLESSCVTLRDTDLYFMMDHAVIKQEVNTNTHTLIRSEAVARDGYADCLFCFSHDLPEPRKIRLAFDSPDACQPAMGGKFSTYGPFEEQDSTWIMFGKDHLFFGLEAAYSPFIRSKTIGCQEGIWVLPLAELDAVLDGQKNLQLEKMRLQTEEKTQQDSTTIQTKQALLKKYDMNHDGVIDAEEREAALDDPAFIESELDIIDASKSGRLDAKELSYFDANNNKKLEPKEEAGIRIARHLLDKRLLKKFDANGDGFLDRQEFENLELSLSVANPRQNGMPIFSSLPDFNRDGYVDLEELDAYMKGKMQTTLTAPPQPGALPVFLQRLPDGTRAMDAPDFFKKSLEFYWQNPEQFARRSFFNNGAATNAVKKAP